MATATKRPSKPKPSAAATLAKLHQSAEERTEQILLAIVRRDDDQPDPDEWTIFDGLGLDKREVSRGLARVRTRLQWQDQAGTAADREAAQTQLATARDQLATEGPTIEAKIAESQAELKKLQDNVQWCEDVAQDHAAAVIHVRKLLPAYAQRLLDRRVDAVRRQYRTAAGYSELTSRQDFLRHFTTMELSTPGKPNNQRWRDAETIRSYLADHGLAESQWPSHRDELKAELEAVAADLAEREAKYAAAVAAIETEILAPYVG